MLIDTHVHMALNGANNRKKWGNLRHQQKKLYIKKSCQSYKNHNVCGIRDGGDRFLISYRV